MIYHVYVRVHVSNYRNADKNLYEKALRYMNLASEMRTAHILHSEAFEKHEFVFFK